MNHSFTTKTGIIIEQIREYLSCRLFVYIQRRFNNVAHAIILLLILSIVIPVDVLGQSTVLTGKVTDAATGQSLSGIDLRLDGQKTTTDSDGRYIFRGLSPGELTVFVEAPGYETIEENIFAEAGETVLSFELERRFGEGDPIFTMQSRHRQSQALSRQKQNTFTSVLSSPQITGFADYSVEDALRRLPGAQSSRSGQISLLGTGLNRYYVMIDGQRLGSTGPGNRNEDPAAISSDMVREMEVISVLRPDMDADGIGGAVNLVTRRPAGGNRELSIRLGGGTNTEYSSRIGAASRMSLNYSEPLLEELTLVIDLNRQVDRYGWESLDIEYNVAEFESGPVDVLERVSPGLNSDDRSKWAGRLQLTWEPDNRTRYHFRGMLNTENRQIVGHRNSWIANGNWENQNQTGPQGLFGYDLSQSETSTHYYTFKAGGEHLFDLLNISYNAGWAYGLVNRTGYRFPFRNTGVQHSIQMNDRSRPVMEMMDTQFREGDMRLDPMEFLVNNHINNRFSGRINAEMPFFFGSIKLGSSALLTSKDALDEGAYREYLYTFRGNLFLDGFELTDENPTNVFNGTYPLPWSVDSKKSQRFFDTNVPNFRLDEELFHELSDIWNYHASENIYAGYGMTTVHFGDFTVMAGARFEFTDADYKGQIVEYNQFDRYQQTTDTTLSASYMDLFPNAQLQYNISNNSSVQLAYSRSISRPDYNHLAPFKLINASDTTLFRGNPDLKPVYSDNLNLSFEQYLSSIGVFSVELFYKDIGNFTSVRERTINIQEGEYAMFDVLFTEDINTLQTRETQYQNSDETARVYGAVLSWQQYLNFLPASLGQLGTYLNYTWSFSEFSTNRDDDVELPGQSPHVINAAIDHQAGRITSQVSFHYTASMLENLQQSRTLAPSIHSQEELYMDRFGDGWMDLSVSLGFRISNNIRFWADIYNLMGNERIQYARSRSEYPTQIQLQEGTEFRLGVRFDL